MNIEIINTGSELMLGRVLNTHQQWLCRQLSDLGYRVTRQVAIADTGVEIQQAVRESLSRADLVIVTGGLGPTSDDITRDLVATLLERKLVEDASIVDQLQRFFASRKRPMPERTRLQAQVPEGALVLANAYGTAPGLAMHVKPNPFRAGGSSSWLVMLPGPPRELRPMFADQVLPWLREKFPPAELFVCRTLKTTGMGESLVEAKIAPELDPLVREGLVLGYCARPGQVDVRLSARGQLAETLVHQAESAVRSLLKSHVYGLNEEELEWAVVRALTEQKKTLAVAESCTGGCLSHRLTNIPGASAVYMAGWITYSNQAKQQSLGVAPETLAQYGAVSEHVARQMAEGARQRAGTDYGLAVTGIAGPGGGTPQKPVGTVFIGCAGPFGTEVERHLYPMDRETFKQVVAQLALDLLRRKLVN